MCTLTSKCPEVVRDIQKGKNPVICSFQSSEAIVCCPKRNTQPNQQVWSNNNNNNNQYYQQGSSANQSPFNQIYTTQPPDQIYQPNQVNQFYHPNQVYQPTKAPTQNYQEVVPNRHSDLRRSEQSKYKKTIIEKNTFSRHAISFH